MTRMQLMFIAFFTLAMIAGVFLAVYALATRQWLYAGMSFLVAIIALAWLIDVTRTNPK